MPRRPVKRAAVERGATGEGLATAELGPATGELRHDDRATADHGDSGTVAERRDRLVDRRWDEYFGSAAHGSSTSRRVRWW